MSSTTKIVVLGGGYAGVEAAQKLHKKYKRNPAVEITLIDRNPYHTLMTELHEIAGSRTEPEAVQVSFKRIFSGTSVKVVIDEIEGIDFEASKLRSNIATYDYDYLVLSTGGHPEFFGIPGIQENSFSLWSLEDAIRIRQHVELMFRAAAKEPDPEMRKRQLTFAVAGAGFTGIELIGELMERADTLCRKYHIDREDVRLIVIEAQDRVLPILSEKPQRKALQYMQKKGVEVLLNAPIVKGEPGRYTLKSGQVIEAETFVWTCGIQGSEFTAKINLTKGRVSNDKCSIATPEGIHGMAGCHFDDDERDIVGERGRILVNGTMQSVDYPNVYLAGDMIWYLHDEKVVPQIVENALQTADVAAHNISARIDGNEEKKTFVPNFHGFMVSIGGKYAVASVMGLNLYGFMAMALKHMVNLHYLWGLAGFNACWTYLQDQFFKIKNRRSILRGHASAKVPAYWTIPARLWLGLMWLFEGINKIGEGWFNFELGSKSSWMFSRGVTQSGIKPAADATSAASDAGAAAPAAADALSAATDAGAGTAAAGSAAAPDAVSAATDAVATGTAAAPAAQVADAVSAATDAATTAAPATATTAVVDAVSAATDAVAAGSAAAPAADAVSAATDAVAATVAVAADAAGAQLGKVWDLDKTILDYNSGIVTWFRQTFMDGIFANLDYSFFQIMIVGMEMGIGLMLLGGFLTFPAAVASIGMCLIFTLSGMFSWAQLWFVFLAIVLMGGAGHAAGLDHWVMPWVRDKWNSTKLAQRTFLYSGEPITKKRKK